MALNFLPLLPTTTFGKMDVAMSDLHGKPQFGICLFKAVAVVEAVVEAVLNGPWNSGNIFPTSTGTDLLIKESSNTDQFHVEADTGVITTFKGADISTLTELT